MPARWMAVIHLSASLALATMASRAEAAAPFAKQRAPGVIMVKIGQFEVTALNDGATRLDAMKLLNEPPAATEAALARVHVGNPVATSVNAFLINTGERLILVDTGAGSYLGPALGQLQSSLRAAGYAPEQVDDILLTHMHRDHVGGLIADGAIAFKNATIHADRREADYWLSKPNIDQAAPDAKARFQGVVDTVGAYAAVNRFKPFDGDVEVLPHVRAAAAPGHTVGLTGYVIESDGQRLWLVGDLINFGAVQFDHPQISSSFDGDGDLAATTRADALKRAANDSVMVGAAHLPYPGLGNVKASGTAWQWMPIKASAPAL